MSAPECDCRVVKSNIGGTEYPMIRLCPLHASAPDLKRQVDALRAVVVRGRGRASTMVAHDT